MNVSIPDLYHQLGDGVNEAEGFRMHTSFSQQLLKDHFQSSKMSEHGIIQVRFVDIVTIFYISPYCPFLVFIFVCLSL